MTTWHFLFANVSAMVFPTLRAPPVTRAIFPFRSMGKDHRGSGGPGQPRAVPGGLPATLISTIIYILYDSFIGHPAPTQKGTRPDAGPVEPGQWGEPSLHLAHRSRKGQSVDRDAGGSPGH